jgi:acyl carrier protein
MRPIERISVMNRIREWLVQAGSGAATLELAPDTDIIESRVLESLQVVELILFLEEMSGRTILSENLNPSSLRTLDTIYNTFFEVRS